MESFIQAIAAMPTAYGSLRAVVLSLDRWQQPAAVSGTHKAAAEKKAVCRSLGSQGPRFHGSTAMTLAMAVPSKTP
ncbi:hypothetical protein [Streptomyces sp. NPDC055134]